MLNLIVSTTASVSADLKAHYKMLYCYYY